MPRCIMQFNKGEPTPARAPLADATQHINQAVKQQLQAEAAVKPGKGSVRSAAPPAPPPLPPRGSLMPGVTRLLLSIHIELRSLRMEYLLLSLKLHRAKPFRGEGNHGACSASGQACSSSGAQGRAQAASPAAREGRPRSCRCQRRAAAAGEGACSYFLQPAASMRPSTLVLLVLQ